ncbi:hypothetical protein Hanom_Chr09g00821621 [Helianthus anomalus]
MPSMRDCERGGCWKFRIKELSLRARRGNMEWIIIEYLNMFRFNDNYHVQFNSLLAILVII